MPILNVEHITDEDISDIEFTNIKTSKSKSNYVNNKKLYAEFIEYNKKKQEWIKEGKPGHPPLTNIIGEAILQIAKRRCYSRYFISYTPDWKEEMVEDAIVTAVANCHGFNPEKSNNPFAYLTQIITNAIIQRIKIEHKENYIKLKSYDNARGFMGDCDDNISEDDLAAISECDEMYNSRLEKISIFENANNLNKKENREKKKHKSPITLFDYTEYDDEEEDIEE